MGTGSSPGKNLEHCIIYLIDCIALTGHYGLQPSDFREHVRKFYRGDVSRSDGADVTSTSTVQASIDEAFLGYIWSMLLGYAEVVVQGHRTTGKPSLAEADDSCKNLRNRDGTVPSRVSNSGSAQCQSGLVDERTLSGPVRVRNHRPISQDDHQNGVRLLTGEIRMWYALTGHEPDYVKVRSLDFVLLSIIASHGAKGILQHDLVRISGQDKRSLPHRTDRLAEDQYIVKERVICIVRDAGEFDRKLNTSLCTLKRFARTTDHEAEVLRFALEANSKKSKSKALRKQEVEDTVQSPTIGPLGEFNSYRFPPQWVPDRSIVNQIYTTIHQAGKTGVTLPELRTLLFGDQFRKPIENIVGRLVDTWQISQPLPLRHLAVIRDTVLRGKSPIYIHYTFTTFQGLVDEGKASWEAVTTLPDHVKQDINVCAAVSAQSTIDKDGFPPLDQSEFQDSTGSATLAACAKSAKCRVIKFVAPRPKAHNIRGQELQASSKELERRISIPRTRHEDPRISANAQDLLEAPLMDGLVRSPRHSTVVKKKSGRPRKYPKTGVPPNIDSMPFEELRQLHQSRQMAEKYEKLKITCEIDRRIDLGAEAVSTAHEVLKETDDEILEAGQDPLFPQVRARILHEYAGGPEPLPTDLDLAFAKVLSEGAGGLRKKSKSNSRRKVTGTAIRYVPSIAAHTLWIPEHKGSPSEVPNDTPNGHANGLDNTTSQIEAPALPSTAVRSSIVAVAAEKEFTMDVDERTKHANHGSKKGVSDVKIRRLIRNRSSDARLAHEEHEDSTAAENSARILSMTSEVHRDSNDVAVDVANASHDARVAQILDRRRQEQISGISRQKDGCYIAGEAMLVSRATDAIELPKIPYKMAIFKLKSLSNLWRKEEHQAVHGEGELNMRLTVNSTAQSQPSVVSKGIAHDDARITALDSEDIVHDTSKRKGASSDIDYAIRRSKRRITRAEQVGTEGRELEVEEHVEAVQLPRDLQTGSRSLGGPHMIAPVVALAAPWVCRPENFPVSEQQRLIPTSARPSGMTKDPKSSSKEGARMGPPAIGKILRTGGSMAIIRREIILDLVKKAGGVCPGYREMSIPFGVEWVKKGFKGLPESQTVRTAVNNLCAVGKLRQLTFAFQTKGGLNKTANLLTLPEILPSDSLVSDLKEKIKEAGPNRTYLPHAWLEHTSDAKDESHSTSRPHEQYYGKKREAFQRLQTHRSKFEKIRDAAERTAHSADRNGDTLRKPVVENLLKITQTTEQQIIHSMPGRSFERGGKSIQRLTTLGTSRSTDPVYMQNELDPIQHNEHIRKRRYLAPDLQAGGTQNGHASVYRIDQLPSIRKLGSTKTTPRVHFDNIEELYSDCETYQTDVVDETDDVAISGLENHYLQSDYEGIDPKGKGRSTIARNPSSIRSSRSQPPVMKPLQRSTEHDLLPRGVPDNESKHEARGADLNIDTMSTQWGWSLNAERPRLSKERQLSRSARLPMPTSEILDTEHTQRQRRYDLANLEYVDVERQTHERADQTEAGERLPDGILAYSSSRQYENLGPVAKSNHTQEMFASEIEQSLRWELQNLDGGNVTFPTTFINYALPHPHFGVKADNISIEDGKLCYFNSPQSRLRSRSINESSRIRCPPHKLSQGDLIRQFERPVSRRNPGPDTEHDDSSSSSVSAEDADLSTPRIRKRAQAKSHAHHMSAQKYTQERLRAATLIIRCLAGGIERTIYWDLVAASLGQIMSPDEAHRQWKNIEQADQTEEDIFVNKFTAKYLEAYEEGSVPSINYDDLDDYPWKWLLDWALDTIDTKVHELAWLPSSKEILTKDYEEHISGPKAHISYYELDQQASHETRETLLSHTAWTSTLEEDVDLESEEESLSVVKTWVRAHLATPDQIYDARTAAKTLRRFSDVILDRALDSLLENRLLTQAKSSCSGRLYCLSDHTYNRLQQPISLSTFRRAAAYKRILDEEFNKNGRMLYSRHAEDGDMMAILNLSAARRIRLKPTNVPMNAYGHTDGDYQTRQMDKTRLYCDIDLIPTKTYLEGNPLNRRIPIPHHPDASLNSATISKVPLWCDIHGGVISDLWDKVLAAILAVIVLRPDVGSKEIATILAPVLGSWEIDLAVEWLIAASAVRVTFPPSVREQRYEPAEWFWMIFAD